MSELKPCPFCGSSADLRSSAVTGIRCNNNFCGLESPRYANDDVEKLIRWWNTRPADAVREAARKVLDLYVSIDTEVGPAWATPDAETHWALVKKGGHLDSLRAALAQDGRTNG